MLRRSCQFALQTRKRSSLTLPKTAPITRKSQDEIEIAQAPNRVATWSPSQSSKDHIIKTNVRFVGRDLTKQPNPQAAIDLIAQQPIRYIHNNIAVCSGTDIFQGHPKVYINLDKDMPGTCGYCGLRYAREELKDKLS